LLTNLDDNYIRLVNGKQTDIKEFMSSFYYIGECDIPSMGVLQNRTLMETARKQETKYMHIIKNKMVIY
jgi:hypothetical protein